MKKLMVLFFAFAVWGQNAVAANTGKVCYTYGYTTSTDKSFNAIYTEIGAIQVDENWKYDDKDYYHKKPKWKISNDAAPKFNLAVTTLMNANKPADVPAYRTLEGFIEDSCYADKETAEKQRQGSMDAHINYYKNSDVMQPAIHIVKGAWDAEFKITKVETSPAKVTPKVPAEKTTSEPTTAKINGPILTRTFDANTAAAEAAKKKENTERHQTPAKRAAESANGGASGKVAAVTSEREASNSAAKSSSSAKYTFERERIWRTPFPVNSEEKAIKMAEEQRADGEGNIHAFSYQSREAIFVGKPECQAYNPNAKTPTYLCKITVRYKFESNSPPPTGGAATSSGKGVSR